METTFDVRISEKIQTNTLARGRHSYTVRWRVAKEPFKKNFGNLTLAKSERSRLMSAVGRGEAFYIDTGRPISEARTLSKVTFYEVSCEYVDANWPRAAANTRRSIADALVAVTPVMLKGRKSGPDAKALRKALQNWAFNTAHRERASDEVRALLTWVERGSRPFADLAKADVIRATLGAVGSKLDGKPASSTYAARRRAVLWNLCEFGVEKGYLSANPISTVKWSRPKRSGGTEVVDPATVPNPQQAEALLDAVGSLPGSGPRLKAFFGSMYYAALRPGEAVELSESNLRIPSAGRGRLFLTGSTPWAGGSWTVSGDERDARQLKHREIGAGRWTPCPSKLTALLHWHLETYGVDRDGHLFWGQRGGLVPGKTYQAAWGAARVAALGEDLARTSNLARRPYDLRHAAVSTWLASGVEAKRVAEWAGQSLEVLMRIYAKVLDGLEEEAMERIDSFLLG